VILFFFTYTHMNFAFLRKKTANPLQAGRMMLTARRRLDLSPHILREWPISSDRAHQASHHGVSARSTGAVPELNCAETKTARPSRLPLFSQRVVSRSKPPPSSGNTPSLLAAGAAATSSAPVIAGSLSTPELIDRHCGSSEETAPSS
jgi:hypothetical protein